MLVRERLEPDAEALVRLAESVHDLDGYPPYLPNGDYRELLFGHETLGAWVAEIDGIPVGQVALHLRTGRAAMALAADALGVEAERLGVVARLLVSPAHRRQGVAAELLFRAARAAVDAGLFPMLDVATTLKPAIELYERNGWVRAGQTTVLLPNGPLEEYVYLAPGWLRPAISADPRGTRRRWDGPPIEAWEPLSPEDLAKRLAVSRTSWAVVGGWAVDLAAGRTTRPHEDIEIATIGSDLAAVHRALAPLVAHLVGDGQVWRPAGGDSPPAGWSQTWMLDEAAGKWRVDVMTEPGDINTWVYRRDPRITAPRDQMIGQTHTGVPYLRPHGALLYKAPRPLAKNEADFPVAAAKLTADERDWLTAALATTYPGHPWIRRLADA